MDGSFDELLDAARRGEAAALRALWTGLSPPVASFLRTRGVRDVDDVTSEVFLSVFSGLDRFSGDERAMRAWVLTIAHHRWVDERRRDGRRVPVTDYEPGEDTRRVVSAEDEVAARMGTEWVRSVLDRLSPDQRDVLVLRLVEDLTIEQVAGILGKRTGAVKALQRRGLDALRRIVEQEGVPR